MYAGSGNLAKLRYRIIEERQLLAEEKWIIDTLTKIKNQKNCLQIERLHLENMKAHILLAESRTNPESIARTSKAETAPNSGPSTVSLMQNVTSVPNPEFKSLGFSLGQESICNEESLNLAVTNSVFSNDPRTLAYDMEEEDEEREDVLLDMDMLMSDSTNKRLYETPQEHRYMHNG